MSQSSVFFPLCCNQVPKGLLRRTHTDRAPRASAASRVVCLRTEQMSKSTRFFFFFLYILRRMGKNKALAHLTSTYFHTRRVSIQLSCFRSPTLAGLLLSLSSINSSVRLCAFALFWLQFSGGPSFFLFYYRSYVVCALVCVLESWCLFVYDTKNERLQKKSLRKKINDYSVGHTEQSGFCRLLGVLV